MEFGFVVDRYIIFVFKIDVLEILIVKFCWINFGMLLLILVVVMVIKVVDILDGLLVLLVVIKII